MSHQMIWAGTNIHFIAHWWQLLTHLYLLKSPEKHTRQNWAINEQRWWDYMGSNLEKQMFEIISNPTFVSEEITTMSRTVLSMNSNISHHLICFTIILYLDNNYWLSCVCLLLLKSSTRNIQDSSDISELLMSNSIRN